MKKIPFIFAIIISTTITLSAQFSGGSGTQTDPYQITSKADMEALSDSCFYGNYWSMNKYFLLMNDITDSCDYRSIGGFQNSPHYFYGYFDGNNHTIYLKVSAQSNILFGNNLGTIANLRVTGKSYEAGICYYNGLRPSDATHPYSATIINCSNNATITGIAASGICSVVVGGFIKKCTNTGNIIGSTVSGILGLVAAGSIEDCVNAGFIRGTFVTGGIISMLSSGCNITRCINTAALEGTENVGAIVGNLNGATTTSITDCFYDIQMCKYKAVNNQDHPGVTGLPTHLLMNELAR